MQSVGVDSCVYKRQYEDSEFEALLGVAITTLDRDKFRKHYDDVLKIAFDAIGEKPKKQIYKAAHLTAQLQDATSDFLDCFIQSISSELIRVNIFYSYYPEDKIDRIYTCQDSYIRPFPPKEFLKKINNAYPHYCVWRYLEAHPDCRNYIFEVDHFEGKITPAWRKISDMPNLHIYYSGNECNKIISSADLFLRFICNKVIGDLNGRNLVYCLKDILNKTKIHSYYMGYRSDYLKTMAFTDDLMINTRFHLKHPIYWIVWKNISKDKDEKTLFEWSEKYNDVMKEAENNGGCVRFYKASDIPHLLDQEKDNICLINDEAESIISVIKSIARDVKILDFRGRK